MANVVAMTNKISVIREDSVRLIKEIGKLTKVGETYEVADFVEVEGSILVVVRDRKKKIAMGAIPLKEFHVYFERVADKMHFTPWTAVADGNNTLVGFYRTNGKKVQYKTTDGMFRGESSCNKMDNFSLLVGLSIAQARCFKKHYNSLIEEVENAIKIATEVEDKEAIEIANKDKEALENAITTLNNVIEQIIHNASNL